MPDWDVGHLSREELEAEVRQLRAGPASTSLDKARQDAVFDSALDFAMVVTDAAGTITGWNKGAEHIMGWTAEAMRGQNASRFFTPEDRAAGRVAMEMQIALRDGRASDERWHVKQGDERFWASGEIMPLLDEDGRHLGFLKILRDRTAEHLAGKALQDAERQLRRAQEAGGVGLFTVDLSTNQLRPTPEFCRLYGLAVQESYPAAAVEGRIVAEDTHLVSTAASRACGEYINDVEYRVRRVDTGEIRWINRKGEIERDENGTPIRFSGVARDVTLQRTTTDALAASEARFRTIIETIDAAFAIVEVKFDAEDRPVDYRFVEANPAFERQAGINLRGKWVTEFAPNLERFWFETYGHVAKTGEPVAFENYAEAFERWFDVRAVRVGAPAERRIAIFFTDVTERRSAEERLRASEAVARENVERVQLALDAGAIIGTWHWHIPADRFTVDDAFARAFGLDPALGHEGIPLAQIVETVHPDDKAGLAHAIDEALARGGSYAHQYRVRRADGRYHWIEGSGRVELAPDGSPQNFPGVLLDVEERRAVQRERDRVTAELRALTETLEQRVGERTADLMLAEEQLRQSQKMEAVGQLTGGLAHDFNNLLTGVIGSLELLKARIAQGRINDVDRYIEAAQGAANRAAALTHRLLAFSRRQTLDPKPTDVNRLVAGMEEMVRRTIGPAIDMDTMGPADLWATLVDPGQLENALLNLCINARDAMPDGGRLTVEAANRHLDPRVARERDMEPGEYVSLCVTDTGAGMSPEVVAKALDPFFTTKPIGMGTGLGLSMIYGFAKQSGGQVRLHSELGRGTTVCLYLPRHRGEAQPAKPAPDLFDAPRAEAGQTVLVVDDEPTVRSLVTEVLVDLGYAAIEAADAASGLAILRSDVRVDLLVTDVGLPGGMNGRQMADAARVFRPELRVLFITGYAENAVLSHGHLEPGMHVLVKPFAMEGLAKQIKHLISA